VREELIQSDPAMVQELVNLVQGAGEWLDTQQTNRDKAVAIAATEVPELNGTWRSSEITDSTLTVSNLGEQGVETGVSHDRTSSE